MICFEAKRIEREDGATLIIQAESATGRPYMTFTRLGYHKAACQLCKHNKRAHPNAGTPSRKVGPQ
jgi:hypothetical protein